MISYKLPDNILPDHIKLDALSAMDPFNEPEPEGMTEEEIAEEEYGQKYGRE
jgi:hypothetical protein